MGKTHSEEKRRTLGEMSRFAMSPKPLLGPNFVGVLLPPVVLLSAFLMVRSFSISRFSSFSLSISDLRFAAMASTVTMYSWNRGVMG